MRHNHHDLMSSYITSGRRTRLQQRIARIEARLTALYAQADALDASTTESYRFDSGEGSQSVTRKKSSDIDEQIRQLEATLDSLYNELNNIGIVCVRLRRTS